MESINQREVLASRVLQRPQRMRLRSDIRGREAMWSCRGWSWRARMPCSHFQETRVSVLGVEEVGQPGFESFPRRHYPDRVRGYLLSPTSWSTPVSVNTIETPLAMGMQMRSLKTRSASGPIGFHSADGLAAVLTFSAKGIVRGYPFYSGSKLFIVNWLV